MLVIGLLLFVLAVTWAVLGVHGLLLGRMPGNWLDGKVRRPRLWGGGALLMIVSLNAHSPSLFVVGIGLVLLGHVVKPR
ncbi:hypothetical protein [Streptomyces adustus]